MEEYVIRVYYRGEILGEKVERAETVPRVGELLEVGNASWTVGTVLWKWFGTHPIRRAVCSIHFTRDSEGGYWTKEKFWRDNGFFEQATFDE